LAAEVEKIALLEDQPKGGRPPYPIETMVRIVVLKRLYGLSDEQMEYQLLDRMSFKRFCGLEHSRTVPDRTTIWLFENRIGAAGAQALFEAVKRQIERKGYIARGGQIVDATLVRAPRQHFTREEQEMAHGVAREVQRHSLVRPTHGRSVPAAAVGRKKPGHEAATSGQNEGKSGGIQCRVS
jgi:IS5 family transposase